VRGERWLRQGKGLSWDGFGRGVPPTAIKAAKATTIQSARQSIRVASRRSSRTTMRGFAWLIAGSDPFG